MTTAASEQIQILFKFTGSHVPETVEYGITRYHIYYFVLLSSAIFSCFFADFLLAYWPHVLILGCDTFQLCISFAYSLSPKTGVRLANRQREASSWCRSVKGICMVQSVILSSSLLSLPFLFFNLVCSLLPVPSSPLFLCSLLMPPITRIASRHHISAEWESVGDMYSLSADSYWYADTPKEEWPGRHHDVSSRLVSPVSCLSGSYPPSFCVYFLTLVSSSLTWYHRGHGGRGNEGVG